MIKPAAPAITKAPRDPPVVITELAPLAKDIGDDMGALLAALAISDVTDAYSEPEVVVAVVGTLRLDAIFLYASRVLGADLLK